MGSLIAPLFSADAIAVEGSVSLVDDQILPEEWEYIQGAAPKRRAEFGTARVFARRALAALGVAPEPLLPGVDRAPLWPSGITGSVTHTSDYCAVVARRSPPCRSVGLDAEEVRPLDDFIVRLVSTPTERRWLSGRPGQARDVLTLLLFSAKEAYYKLQYRITGRMLDFQDVEVDIRLAAGSFEARTAAEGVPPDLTSVTGRFRYAAGKVLCGVELPCDPTRELDR
jgi:4'-phosphopantetheinyl transferase EntD